MLREFPLLTDENIDSDVVQFLRNDGFDVVDVYECGLNGATDSEILARAFSEGRVVLTHDRDFGTLCVLAGQDAIGIIYMRPGHIDPQFTVGSLKVLLNAGLHVIPHSLSSFIGATAM
ncbi:MAG: DUF5615 family PIN-like protein [Planctomycetaceae bacterium]